MNKFSLAAVVAACMSTTTAYAGVFTNVDLLNGSGTTLVSNAAYFDENGNSSGAALGIGPIGSPLAVGQTFTFNYQSNIVAFNDNGGTPITNNGGLNSNYEVTAVASLLERVTYVAADGSSANFSPIGGTFSFFYDTNVNADNSTGQGFVDGTEIARFSVLGGGSSFSTITLTGGTQYDFVIRDIIGSLDFVDANYLVGLLPGADGKIDDLHFKSSQNYPPTFNPTVFFGGTNPDYPEYTVDTCDANSTPGSCDLMLSVDGLTNFTVPEPGTIALMGLGLLGLGLGSRRGFRRNRNLAV